MAILFAGTEGEAFAVSGNVNTSTVGGEYDSDYSRCGLACHETGELAIPIGNLTEIWVHGVGYFRDITSVATAAIIRVDDTASTNTVICQIDMDGTVDSKLEYWDGSVYQEQGSDLGLTSDVLTTFDLHVDLANSGGTIEIFIDGVSKGALTGDTLLSDFTDIDRVRFRFPSTNSSSAFAVVWSEIIIADEDTRDMRLATLHPDGAGNATAWTGAYTDVDEAGLAADGDLVTSNTADQIEQFTMSNLSATADNLVPVALVESCRARNAATGPQNVQFSLRTNSTDFVSSSVSGIGTGYAAFQNIRTTNPDTTNPWSASELNGLELGVKAIT